MAGRIVSKRGMGKVMFCDLKDYAGRIQLYVRMDEMETPEAYDRFKKMDIGDIVGVKGDVFRTQKGRFLSGSTRRPCSARPCCPPEKFHGLTDLETRYRQRYVDLIVNPEVRRTFEIRSRFISYIRRFLDDQETYSGWAPPASSLPAAPRRCQPGPAPAGGEGGHGGHHRGNGQNQDDGEDDFAFLFHGRDLLSRDYEIFIPSAYKVPQGLSSRLLSPMPSSLWTK